MSRDGSGLEEGIEEIVGGFLALLVSEFDAYTSLYMLYMVLVFLHQKKLVFMGNGKTVEVQAAEQRSILNRFETPCLFAMYPPESLGKRYHLSNAAKGVCQESMSGFCKRKKSLASFPKPIHFIAPTFSSLNYLATYITFSCKT